MRSSMLRSSVLRGWCSSELIRTCQFIAPRYMGGGASKAMSATEVAAQVQQLISNNKVMVFSKAYCPFCHKAKAALRQFTSEFEVLELDSLPDGPVYQNVLADMTGGRSVPRVFIDGQFLGGGDETAAAARDGTLQKLLTDAGVKGPA